MSYFLIADAALTGFSFFESPDKFCSSGIEATLGRIARGGVFNLVGRVPFAVKKQQA